MRRLGTCLLALTILGAACSSGGSSGGSSGHRSAATPDGTGSAPGYYDDVPDRGYDVTHYDVRIAYTPKAGTIRASTVVAATATHRLTHLTLDLHGLSVTRAVVHTPARAGGQPARFERGGDHLVISPERPIARGTEFTVAVTYHGRPQLIPDPTEPAGSGAGGIGWTRLHDGTVFVVSEPDGARSWFPGNDHPADKATFAIHVDVPAPYSVASNGHLAATPSGTGNRRWDWTMDHPMATYLATVVIATLDEQQSTSPAGVPIRNFFPTRTATDDARTFARAGEMVDYFSSIISPYPFGEYGQAVVPTDLGYALENQTLSLFGHDMLGSDQDAQLTIAHELAHQWFGDSVGITRWSDIWLNEAFANYLQYVWMAHADPSFDLNRTMANLRADKAAELGPILDPGAAGTFSDSVYDRGALTLHALRTTIGDDAFFTLLRRWTVEHRDGVATTKQFVALAEEVSGRNLDAFFHAWLRAPKVPPLPR